MLRREFDARGCSTGVATDAAAAADLMKGDWRDCDGLITDLGLDGDGNGWGLARNARELNPDIAVGYLSAEGHRDWAVYGVPNSILLNKTFGEAEIATAFLRLCGKARRASDHVRRPEISGVDTAETILSTDAVRHEREDLLKLFMQTPSFIAFLEGPEHRFTFANAAYLQVVERANVVGQRVIDAFPEVIAQGFVQILDRIYCSGEPFIAKGVEIIFRREDGSDKQAFLDFIYHPVRDRTGEITGIFVEGDDVTEYHKAQERIGILQNNLIHVARVNAMGMLASTIAHELSQPLATIHNYMTAARMVMERQDHDPLVTKSLRGAADAALRAGDIIRNLRSMTVRREVLRKPVRLEEALREAAALASIGRTKPKIEFDLASTAQVQGDRIQIQQVLFNLIQNALEMTTAKTVDVTISTADKGSFVEIRVIDNGPGIDLALLPTIFDSFMTTKVDGTGIGLSICRAIVEGHGGTIHACNRPGAGAIFSFTLPRSGESGER